LARRDIAVGDKDWRILLLRYFNPIGAPRRK
jgi:UDP-glucose 4-epimerase